MQKLNPRIVKNLRKAKLQKNHGSKLEFLQIGNESQLEIYPSLETFLRMTQ